MKSFYAANAILAHRYGGPNYTRPATVYVGLLLQDPQPDASELSEPPFGAYDRVALTNNDTNFPEPVDGELIVGVAVEFPMPTGPWGTVTHFAIFDALSGGNMLDYGPILDPDEEEDVPIEAEINTGDTVIFEIGSLVIKEE